jgi:hypothetical protein
MAGNTIDCPCCCNACANFDTCCEDAPSPNCSNCTCDCERLGDDNDGFQNEPIGTCPPGKILETIQITGGDIGVPEGNCAPSTCYRCVDEDGLCVDCDYDGEPDYNPSPYDFCCWEPFTQTVTTGSSTPGCEDCFIEYTQEVYGSQSCDCECSFLGEGWQPTVPQFCDHVIEADVDSEDAGCSIGMCNSQTCYKCDEGDEGCWAVVGVSGSGIGNATCTTNFTYVTDNACRYGTPREVAELGVDVSLSVSCPATDPPDHCDGEKPGNYGLQDCIYAGAGTNTVTYKFEDCNLNDPDFEITITLEQCFVEECFGDPV